MYILRARHLATRTKVVHLVIDLFLVATVIAVGVASSSEAAAPDPLTCEGYEEPRIYLESHAWWNTILSGSEDFGHLHTES